MEPSHKYVEYYNLVEAPFGLTPNPRFVYLSRSHSAALEQLLDALDRREGLIVITGEIGTGKTTICRTLLQHLPPRTLVSVIPNPFLDADDFLKQVLIDFGAISGEAAGRLHLGRAGRDEITATLGPFLGSLAALDAHAVIMIDEAQELGEDVLDEIRRLTNLESRSAKPPQIILVGQPGLEALLGDLGLLDDRVCCRCHLQPLAAREVGPYIERRLAVAHGDSSVTSEDPSGDWQLGRVQFTAAAGGVVAALSAGIPRLVNFLCDRSLEIGCERQTRVIGSGTVLAAARRLPHLLPFSQRLPRARLLRVAAAPAMLGAAVLKGWTVSLRTLTLNFDRGIHLQGETVNINNTNPRRIRFRTRPFGFDKTQVRDLLSNLLDDYQQARDQVETLQRQLNRVKGDLVNESVQHAETAHQVERILASAHKVADDIRAEAEREVARLVADAEGRAVRLMEAAANEAGRKTAAAADQLREVEREIERMRACHREVRSALEAAVTAVGSTLADLSARSTLDTAEVARHGRDDTLERFPPEQELKAARGGKPSTDP